MGFYGGWAVAWLVVLRRYRFSIAEAFVLTGMPRLILFEQLGAVFLAMVTMFAVNPLISLLFGFYVFVVHGSIAGIALMPELTEGDGPATSAKSTNWVRFPVAIILMVGFAFAGCAAVSLSGRSLWRLARKEFHCRVPILVRTYFRLPLTLVARRCREMWVKPYCSPYLET